MSDDWKITGLNELVLKRKKINEDTPEIYLPYDESEQDTAWITGLAREEDDIDRTGMISFDASVSPEKVLKDATVSYLRHLRSSITHLASVFNAHKSPASSAIKVYGITNTDADFMVFRNSLKLIFAAQRPGIIQISFNAHTGGFFTSQGQGVNPISSSDQVGDIIHAQLGPFNEAVWTYQGRKINTPEMIKYFLKRFVQNSIR
ncbi:MAG: hypothetical protein JXA66_04310 [Oligoflexia bacterium]|nr:hypothetical protein [Oligoflexia bacterium]